MRQPISPPTHEQAPEHRPRGLFAYLCATSLLVFAGACGDGPTNVDTTPPTIVAVTPPTMGATMARSLVVELDRSGNVQVEYSGPDGPTWITDLTDGSTRHEIDLVRMRPDREYTVSVFASAGGGRSEPSTLTVRTDTLPSHLAALRFDLTGEPTWPLMMLEITVPDLAGSPIIVDDEGEIVWFREGSTEKIHGVGQLMGPGFAVNTQDGLSIVDPDGGTRARLVETEAAARLGLGTYEIHHDVVAYDPRTVLFLVEDTATVEGAVWTGEAIWSWDFVADVLTRRWTSHDAWSPADHAGDRSWTGDWLHANSLAIGPRSNVVVSFFWTHEVASIAPDFGSVEWTLGGPVSSFVVPGGAMDAGQHTAAEIGTDRVLLFDNGLDRPGGALYSRALELSLDRTTGTADVVWEFRPDPDIYAPIVSSVRRLGNGNTVVAFGTAPDFSGLPATGPITAYEVAPSGDVVSQLTIGGASLMYRATPLVTIGGEAPAAAAAGS